MNNVNIIGNLTKDPELKTSGSGKSYCYFTVAVPRMRNGEEKADFFNCVAYDSEAENLCKYQTKGKKVGVTGDLESYQKEGEETSEGYKFDRWKLNARHIDYCSPVERGEAREPSRPAGGGNGQQRGSQQQQRGNGGDNRQRRGAQPPRAPQGGYDGMQEIDEDMPF